MRQQSYLPLPTASASYASIISMKISKFFVPDWSNVYSHSVGGWK